MKARGEHPTKALSAVRVRSLKDPGRYADGNGLYVEVSASGGKSWILRIVVQGRRRDIGLGGLSTVSLAEAREQAAAYRKIARSGGDPIADRQKAAVAIPSFEEAAAAVHLDHKAGWKNDKHAAQWLSTLEAYAYPLIGKRPVNQIDTPDILKVLSPIWLEKPETARRVRQRLRAVLDWAAASGYRKSENPVSSVSKGLPRQNDREKHHSAMPYQEVPSFIASLPAIETSDSGRLALEFLILTAARTGEVLGAMWQEVDLPNRLWTVPAERMKAGREHRVPLSTRAFEILAIAGARSDQSGFVFPGRKMDKPLSNMALLMAMRRAAPSYTVHGFRSSFRDWTSEQTNVPSEVAEAALAHTIKDKVEAAYRRSDLFERRRDLMNVWERFAIERSSASAGYDVAKQGKQYETE